MLFINLYLGITALILSVGHEYHVGLYHLYFKDQGIQISQKLFIDDFEKALMLSGKAVKIGDDLQEEKVSSALQEYIKHHFALSYENKEIPITYIGAEWEDYHTIFLYWEVEKLPENMSELKIRNTIFLEVSNDQQNMHHIHSADKEHSLLLERNKTEGSINIR